MKVTLKCNLRGKKLWRKGTVLSGPPFPSDIAEEIEAVQAGRVDTLTIENDDLGEVGVRGSIAGTALRQELIDREILFREFEHPILNRVVYRKPEIQYQSTPWFFHQHGANKKRQLLLRKFQ